MPKRGYNSVTVHRSLRFIRTFTRRQLEEKKGMYHPSDFVAQTLLNLWKDTFLKDFTIEEFNEEKERYSITAEKRNEQKREKNRQKAELEERKLRLQEEKVKLEREKIELLKENNHIENEE